MHTIILLIFIKPNITSLLNHLYNEFNKFYWTNTSVMKCTHTFSLLNFVELNTSVLNAHIQWVYLNLLNQGRSPGERVSKRLQSLTETKTRCNVFAAVYELPIGQNTCIGFETRYRLGKHLYWVCVPVRLLGQASLPISKIDTAYQYHRTVSKTLPQGTRYTFGGYQNWSN